jgi:hypothetical protein
MRTSIAPMLGNWVKFPTEILNSPRYGNLTPKLWRLAAELRLIKGMKPQDPILPPIEEIQWKTHASDIQTLKEDLEALREIGILDHDGKNLLYPNIVEEGEYDSDKVRKARQRENERLSRNGHDSVTIRDLERGEVERQDQDQNRAEADHSDSVPATPAYLIGDLAKKLTASTDGESTDPPDDAFWEGLKPLRPEIDMEKVREKMESYCRKHRMKITREYAKAWVKREKKPLEEIPPEKPRKPKIDVALEQEAFRWRSQHYPDSMLVHPTWKTFPFKIWPKSTQYEFLTYKKQLKGGADPSNFTL